MLRIHALESLEDASRELWGYATLPQNWVALDSLVGPEAVPALEASEYQRRVGSLRVCASVDVDGALEAKLHIAFRAPGLTPMQATDHLAEFLRTWMPLVPNSEWQVEVDGKWIHFRRPYTGRSLSA